MSGDLLLRWSGRPFSRKLLSLLGLPTPQPLKRQQRADSSIPLIGQRILLGGARSSALLTSLQAQGASEVRDVELAGESSESRSALTVKDQPARWTTLIYDARSLTTIEGLRELYDFFHPRLSLMTHGGRIVLLGATWSQGQTPAAAAAQQGLVGFVKSLAKEQGRKGTTVNLLSLDAAVEAQLIGSLTFLLSPRAAFITAQCLTVSEIAGLEVQPTPSTPVPESPAPAVTNSATSDPSSAAPESSPLPELAQPLQNKVAIVTGAAQGIGAATARRLAQEGARVILIDLPGEREHLEDLARAMGGSALPLDITAGDAADQIISAAEGRIDILVHNAGITRDKTLSRMSEAQWTLSLSVNLESVVRITEKLLNAEVLPWGARVVLVSSIAGIAGNAGQTNYATAKAGLIGYTSALGAQLKTRGICCNAVAPGFIETRMTRALPFAIRQVGRRLSALNQGGSSSDVADAITFFSSPAAAGLYGNTLRVCGGHLLGA